MFCFIGPRVVYIVFRFVFICIVAVYVKLKAKAAKGKLGLEGGDALGEGAFLGFAHEVEGGEGELLRGLCGCHEGGGALEGVRGGAAAAPLPLAIRCLW